MVLMTFGAPAVAQNVESIRKDYNDAKDLEKRQQGDDASDINVFQTKARVTMLPQGRITRSTCTTSMKK